jgi:predicted metalloprotease
MRWLGRRGSGNIEDRRSGGGLAIGGGVGIVAIILSLLFGQNPIDLLNQLNSGGDVQTQNQVSTGTPSDEEGKFVSVVLGDTEDVWNKLFKEMGSEYKEPVLVLFRGQVQSACGFASAATGPFYCPSDQKVYIDLSFYDELKNRFGAPGDFAQAYVIAHEVGHHVQNLLGISQKMEEARGRLSQKEYNRLSVQLELQADFLAGVWAHHDQKMHQVLEEGDIEEALDAANAIGDDRLQRQTQGTVTPDSFTHGTSEQRMRWFKKGFDTGDIHQGDTFSAGSL